MKIVDYDTFVRMPPGTVFQPWLPFVAMETPEIKVDGGREFISDNGKKLWSYNGTCALMPTPIALDGVGIGPVTPEIFFYDGDQADVAEYDLFLIYEKEDLDAIKNLIDWAKGGCDGNPEDCYGAPDENKKDTEPVPPAQNPDSLYPCQLEMFAGRRVRLATKEGDGTVTLFTHYCRVTGKRVHIHFCGDYLSGLTEAQEDGLRRRIIGGLCKYNCKWRADNG